MADQFAGLAEAWGTTPTMMEGVNAGPENDTNKFADWFGSERGQVLIGGMFNAIGSLGAGLAGINAGGTDTTSMGRGAAAATQAYNFAQKDYDARQFVNYIDKRIAKEEAKGSDALQCGCQVRSSFQRTSLPVYDSSSGRAAI